MLRPNVGYSGDFVTGVPNGFNTVEGINTVDGSSWLSGLSSWWFPLHGLDVFGNGSCLNFFLGEAYVLKQ